MQTPLVRELRAPSFPDRQAGEHGPNSALRGRESNRRTNPRRRRGQEDIRKNKNILNYTFPITSGIGAGHSLQNRGILACDPRREHVLSLSKDQRPMRGAVSADTTTPYARKTRRTVQWQPQHFAPLHETLPQAPLPPSKLNFWSSQLLQGRQLRGELPPPPAPSWPKRKETRRVVWY